MTKRFLACGINKFNMPGNDLAGCIPDAHAMGAVAQSLGISADTLTDRSVVKRNVLGWLQGAQAQAKVGELTYVGFSHSGHGTHYPRPEETDGLGEALVMADITELNGEWNPDTIITDVELRDLLNSFPQTCVVEVFLDTCFSGGMDRAVGAGHKNRFLHNPDNPDKVLRLSNSTVSQGLNSNIIMWCASSEAQTSADAYISGGPHGAFTWYWTQAFTRGTGQSRLDLLLNTRVGLRAGHYDQFPRLKCWNAAAQRAVGQ